jgi:protein TonB
MNYLAAFFAAVILHIGLIVVLGGYLNPGVDGAASTEKVTQQDALVVSFYQPPPAKLQSELTESITRLHEPPPAPVSELASQESIEETPADTPTVTTEDVEAPKSPVPQQAVETAYQSPLAAQQSRPNKQTSSPVKIEKPRPLQPIDAEAVYPLGSRLRGEEGAVRILVLIGADGRIDDLQIKQSSGFTALDRAAERALRRTRFEPASRKNQPIAGELTITIRFSLDY